MTLGERTYSVPSPHLPNATAFLMGKGIVGDFIRISWEGAGGGFQEDRDDAGALQTLPHLSLLQSLFLLLSPLETVQLDPSLRSGTHTREGPGSTGLCNQDTMLSGVSSPNPRAQDHTTRQSQRQSEHLS